MVFIGFSLPLLPRTGGPQREHLVRRGQASGKKLQKI